ncbi:MAG: T9SS type A sorting domain-containing protein [Candidatus Hodarchaeota archaeon]
MSNLITLDPSITYQIITGWEAVAEAGQSERPNAYNGAKDVLFDMADDVGVNRLQLSFHSGIENPVDYFTPYITGHQPREYWYSQFENPINDNSDPFVINPAGFQFASLDHRIDYVVLPLKAVLERNNEQLYVHLTYVDFDPSNFEHYTNPEEYAEVILATFKHIDTKYGWVPDGLEVILEPDYAKGWSASQVGNALAAAAQRLEANGYTPDIITPSTTNMGNAITYFDRIMQIPGVSQYISELSYHRYNGVSASNLQAIANRGLQYRINTSMLEWWNPDNTYKTLHEDLKLGRNSAWQQGTLGGQIIWNPKTSILVIDDTNPNIVITRLHEKTKYTRQYYKFVRAGARRIEASSNNNNFDPLAFLNTDGKCVVIVKANSGDSFTIQGLPAGNYGIKYTTGDGKNQPTAFDVSLPDVSISDGQTLTTNIPAAGVITVYAKLSTPVPVELSSFSAEVQGRDIILTWITQTETSNLGFEIQKSQYRNTFINIGFFRGNNATSLPYEYSYIDKNLNNGKYYYRLKQIDIDGRLKYSGTIEVTIEIPKDFALFQNYPNPFNATTSIIYYIPKLIQVKIVVMNLRGQEIVTLIDTLQYAGSYRKQWDASEVCSGIYFYKLQAGEFSQIRKMLLIK